MTPCQHEKKKITQIDVDLIRNILHVSTRARGHVYFLTIPFSAVNGCGHIYATNYS